MRISDWSSDVCSSDLIDCRSAGGPALNDDRSHVRARQFFGKADCSMRIEAVGLRTAVHPILGGVSLLPQARSMRFYREWQSCGPRTEEQTSELQSLMRNSYAVFCLKKKKKN